MLIEWIVGLYDDRNIDCMLNCEYDGWNEINMIMEWRYESDCEWGYVEFENWDWKKWLELKWWLQLRLWL